MVPLVEYVERVAVVGIGEGAQQLGDVGGQGFGEVAERGSCPWVSASHVVT